MINSLNNQTPATGGTVDFRHRWRGNTQRRQELRQAAQAFEAVFIRQLIGSMRNAKLAEDMFGSQATEQFRDMADARLADSMRSRARSASPTCSPPSSSAHRSVPAPPAAPVGRHAPQRPDE